MIHILPSVLGTPDARAANFETARRYTACRNLGMVKLSRHYMPDVSMESHPLQEARAPGRSVSMPRLSKLCDLNYFSVRHTAHYLRVIQSPTHRGK